MCRCSTSLPPPPHVGGSHQPRTGKSTDNAFAESFNGHFRVESLDQHWFASLKVARQTIESGRVEDNTERPHRALGQQTPAARAAAWTKPSEPLG